MRAIAGFTTQRLGFTVAGFWLEGLRFSNCLRSRVFVPMLKLNVQ